MQVEREISVVVVSPPLPLKMQDFSTCEWIRLGMTIILFIVSTCAFVVVGYCTAEECKVAFAASGGTMLFVSVCLGGHLLKYARFKD